MKHLNGKYFFRKRLNYLSLTTVCYENDIDAASPECLQNITYQI